MRLRTIIGFGVGYLLGAKSDTDKFDNLAELYKTVTQSPIFHALMQQAKQAAAQGMEGITGQQPQWAQASSGNGHQVKETAQQTGGQSQEAEEKAQAEPEGGSESEQEQEQQQGEKEKAESGESKQGQKSKQKQSSS